MADSLAVPTSLEHPISLTTFLSRKDAVARALIQAFEAESQRELRDPLCGGQRPRGKDRATVDHKTDQPRQSLQARLVREHRSSWDTVLFVRNGRSVVDLASQCRRIVSR